MVTEENESLISMDKIDKLKSRIKALAIAYVVLTAILLPITYTICIFIGVFFYIPIVGSIAIALVIYIWLYLHERFKAIREIEITQITGQRFLLSGLLIVFVLSLIFNLCITLLNMIRSDFYLKLYYTSSYIILAGLVLFATSVFVIGLNVKEVEKVSKVSTVLLACYILLFIPHFISLFHCLFYSFLPIIGLMHSLLGISITITFYIFFKLSGMKILYLIFPYAWIYVFLDIVHLLQSFFYGDLSLFEGILVSTCILCFIIAIIPFIVKMITIKVKPLIQETRITDNNISK